MKPLMIIPGPGRRRPRTLRKVVQVLAVASCAYVAFFALNALRVSYPLAAPGQRAAPRGAYHVHTTASDGHGTYEEIARAAKEAGLQFVVLTDHNLEELPPPRYESGVLLVFGVELSTPHGHVVALGLTRGLTKEEREADPLGTVAKLGGYTFLAHPEQEKNPWRDWPNAGRATGLEIYSADTMFRTAQASPLTIFGPAATGFLGNPRHGLLTLVRSQPELTLKLVSLAAKAPKTTVCAHDAHGYPPYGSTFDTLSMYLPADGGGAALPEDPVAAAKKVVEDLGTGRGYCAFHAIGDGDGFRLEGVDGSRSAQVGDVLRVHLPQKLPDQIQVRVSGPGTLLEDGRSVRLDGPGAVHLEVWAQVPALFFEDGWKPWLVPSPVHVSPRPSPAAAPVEAGNATATF